MKQLNLHFGANAVKQKHCLNYLHFFTGDRAQQDLSKLLHSTTLQIRYVLNWSQVEEETTRNQWFCVISRLRKCEKSPFVDVCVPSERWKIGWRDCCACPFFFHCFWAQKELVVWVTFRAILTWVIKKTDCFSRLIESIIANYGRWNGIRVLFVA